MLSNSIINEFFCVDELCLDVTLNLASGPSARIKGIVQCDDISASLGHNVTLDTEQVLLFIKESDAKNINSDTLVEFENKHHQVIKVFCSDGFAEILLCPR